MKDFTLQEVGFTEDAVYTARLDSGSASYDCRDGECEVYGEKMFLTRDDMAKLALFFAEVVRRIDAKDAANAKA